MKIVEIDLSEIKVNDNNVKEHPEWHIKQIANSIEEFGFNDPLAIDENKILIEGHGRYEALKLLGYKTAKVIILDHLDDKKKKAYLIAHNKLTLNTEFDMDKLLVLITELKESDFNLSVLGFEDFEIDEYFKGSEDEVLGLGDDKESEEKKQKGLVCPCCGERALKKEFLECDIDG